MGKEPGKKAPDPQSKGSKGKRKPIAKPGGIRSGLQPGGAKPGGGPGAGAGSVGTGGGSTANVSSGSMRRSRRQRGGG